MNVALDEVRGLRSFWERMTGVSPEAEGLTMKRRVMLDAIGLGLGETMAKFGHRPDWDTFTAWIADTVVDPDPVGIARYHAWLDGAPAPDAVRERIASVEAAPEALTPDEIAHWDEHGYVVLRGAATPDQAAEAAALLYGISDATPEDPESWYNRRGSTIMVEYFQSTVASAIRRSPRIHKAFAQLLGTADLWVQIDRMSFNPPARPGSPSPGPRLHWDVSLAPPVPLGIQGILYLTDTRPDQGALEIVPGFHRRIDEWVAAQGDADPRAVDLSAEAITVGAGAGDLVLWHQALPHGASPNSAALPRLAQYLTLYTPEREIREAWS